MSAELEDSAWWDEDLSDVEIDDHLAEEPQDITGHNHITGDRLMKLLTLCEGRVLAATELGQLRELGSARFTEFAWLEDANCILRNRDGSFELSLWGSAILQSLMSAKRNIDVVNTSIANCISASH